MEISGEGIRQARKARALTIEQAAARAGLSVPYWSQVENGKVPGPDTVAKICHALDLDPAPFVNWSLRASIHTKEAAAAYDALVLPESEVTPVRGERGTRRFAVAGIVSADPESNVEFEPSPEDDVEFGPSTVVWRVASDSMEPIARKGQYLFVDPDLLVRDGDLVIVGLKDGRTLFKRYWEDGRDGVTLESAQAGGGYRPVSVRRREIKFVSKVVGVKF